MYRPSHPARRGTVLPLLAITLVALLGFVALSIDIGLMAMARTQCQNAADCAALTGARTLSGNQSANDNFANCEPAARTAVSTNYVQGVAINGSDTTNVVVNIGAYSYDPTAGLFSIKLPKSASDPYDLVQVNVTVPTNATFFGRVFNVSSYSTSATATAAHRPRDVCMIQDFSGSMRFASLMGIPYFGTRDNGSSGNTSGSNNPESVYPTFGHYSATTTAGLQFTTATEINSNQYSPANITESDAADDNLPAIVLDFYQNAPYTTPNVPAFNNTVNSSGPNPPADSTLDSTNLAGGDKPLHISNTSTNGFATDVKDITGGTSKNSLFEAVSATGGYNFYYPSGTTFERIHARPALLGQDILHLAAGPTLGRRVPIRRSDKAQHHRCDQGHLRQLPLRLAAAVLRHQRQHKIVELIRAMADCRRPPPTRSTTTPFWPGSPAAGRTRSRRCSTPAISSTTRPYRPASTTRRGRRPTPISGSGRNTSTKCSESNRRDRAATATSPT